MPNGTQAQEGPVTTGEARNWKEYEQCARLEQELVRNRWTFFTALLSVSLIVGGLALKNLNELRPLLGVSAFAFGWLIFVAAYCHYYWFHRIAHRLRDHLCQLEDKLYIEAYIIRCKRKPLGGFLRYYHWVIDLLALAYTVLLVIVILVSVFSPTTATPS
jgi:hypothetical protein